MIYVLIGGFVSIIYPWLIITAKKGKALKFRSFLSIVVVLTFAISTGNVFFALARG